jgi:hypothetical protein
MRAVQFGRAGAVRFLMEQAKADPNVTMRWEGTLVHQVLGTIRSMVFVLGQYCTMLNIEYKIGTCST